MPTLVTDLAGRGSFRIAYYNITSGYFLTVHADGSIADTLRRLTRLDLNFVQHDPANVHEFSAAHVDFVDQEAGPVTSVGQVLGTDFHVSLPREEFPAFWHAIRDADGFINIAWKVDGEVIEFHAYGGERFAPTFEESRESIDSLRRELGVDTAD